MSPPSESPEILRAAERLAAAVLAECETAQLSLVSAIVHSLAKPWSEEPTLSKRLAGVAEKAKTEAALAEAFANDRAFRLLILNHGGSRVIWPRAFSIRERPHPHLRWTGMPERIAAPGDLAEWLGLRSSELEWFAGRYRDTPQRSESWRHYHCRWIPKRRGPDRLIESPKPFLKSIQRKLLAALIEPIPLHETAHGFRAGRSIKSFAEPHAARLLVLRMDLADFFPSIRRPRVASLFRTAGYDADVAALLAGLVSHTTPNNVLATGRNLSWETRKRFRIPHLPQGAPTSPALSNAIAFRFDRRMAGLAEAAGATYTRYADDLAFSGDLHSDLARGARRFARKVAAIALEEGFHVAHRKTRVMRANQRQSVAGVVVNVRPNASRALFDELKAILHRCETRGIGAAIPENETRDFFRQRLLGRIAAFSQLSAERGQRLRDRFNALDWPAV